MSVFRVEKHKGYTVMSNHHLRNRALSLKAKGLLSQMLSLPEDWDYTLKGLAQINRESIDAIREAVRELEQAGYVTRSRERDAHGCLRGTIYTIYEQPQTQPELEKPAQATPTLVQPTQEKPALDAKATLDACGISRQTLIEEKAKIYEQLAQLNQQIRAERKKIKLCKEISESAASMQRDVSIQEKTTHKREPEQTPIH